MKTPHFLISCVALLALGALLGQLAQVQAQSAPRQYSECFAATTWAYKANEVNEGVAAGQKPAKTTRVPPGWTPIGGGTRGVDAVVIMCR